MIAITIERVLNVARQSPCVRRKYGAMIAWDEETPRAVGFNERVSACCNNSCVREGQKHGANTDIGAEIHAEQAALISLDIYGPSRIYIAALGPDGEPMNGFDNAPCYVCARMLKFAGIGDIYLPVDEVWERFDIDDIMETWERNWSTNA